MWSVKTRPKPGLASLSARSFSDVGFAVGRMSNFRFMALMSEGLVSRVWADLFNATAMGSLPDNAPCPFRGHGAVYDALDPPCTPATCRGHAFVEWRSPVCLPTCRSTIAR